jgi:uncharacterized protein YgiM (DUF1202 family)
MYHRTASKMLMMLYIVIMSIGVSAQNTTCSELVQSALEYTNTSCNETGRNEACYGHGIINVQADNDIKFDKISDIVPITAITSMQLSGMSLDDDIWGVSLMRIQANLPDTLPGQNVQFVLFGDVEIEDKGDMSNIFTATATGGVNVRLRPTTSQNNIIESLTRGEDVTAIGRLEDVSWIQIRLNAENESLIGWVSADYLQSENEFSDLSVIKSGELRYEVMQAFFFKTGIGDSACDEAPESGILIQTPEGARKVNLLANEVAIDLSSTVFVQSQPSDAMLVSVLDGRIIVTALGVSVIAPAGVRVRIPMTADSTPAGPPQLVEYNQEAFDRIPIQLLENDIDIAPRYVAPQPVAPVIISIDNFPNNALIGDRVKRSFYVNFVNDDGDEITRVFLYCVNSTYPNGCGDWTFDGAGYAPQEGWLLSGDWSQGRLGIPIQCGTGGPARQNTTLGVEIADANGFRSNAMTLNFDCVNP